MVLRKSSEVGKTVLAQDLFYSMFISTWFSKVDSSNAFDEVIRLHSLTRDVGVDSDQI